MPSDIMSSNQFVTDEQIITTKFKIARINNSNSIGSRMWFVVQDDKGNLFQRWSMLMDETDAILAVANIGDTIELSYWIETVCDPIFQRIKEEFTRNNIIAIKQK